MTYLEETLFLNVPLLQWLIAVAVAVGGVLIALIVRWVSTWLIRRKSRTKAEAEGEPGVESGTEGRGSQFGLRLIESFVFPVLIIAGFCIAASVLGLDGQTGAIVSSIFVVLFSFSIIRFLIAVVNELFRRAATEGRRVDLSRIRPLRAISVFFIWIAGLLFLLDNLGFDVTAVIAGLGIGGIAVALAAQSLLGDLFSYFVIVFDRPFELGDFLIFGDILGTVERIGVKTTKLRSLSGEQIVVANSDLTGTRVRNYKRMEKRRVVFKIGVVYGTPAGQVRKIPELIRSIIERDELAVFDRAHFASYGDFSLVFEVVYYVASPDYNLYMDIQQRINLAIYDEFQARGIEFAFPTQTIHLAKPEE